MLSRVFLILYIFSSGIVHSNSRQSSNPTPSGLEVSTFEVHGKVGLKNEKGDILIPAEYEALGWSHGKFSVINDVTGYRSKDKWGLIDIANRRITKPEFEDISPAQGFILAARKKLQTQ